MPPCDYFYGHGINLCYCVSILVLVDAALRHRRYRDLWLRIYPVSILVLVDAALRLCEGVTK